MTKAELIAALAAAPDDAIVAAVEPDGEVRPIIWVNLYPGDENPIQFVMEEA